MSFKFAHLADIHLGFEQYKLPFRAEEFKETFKKAIEKAVEEKVDFILISGDLFHSSKPSPQTIRDAIEVLSIPKEHDIPIFSIEGNHDRTLRKVSIHKLLEDLGLLNLIGFTEEKKESEYLETIEVKNRLICRGIFSKGNDEVVIYGMKYMSSAWFERNKLSDYFKPEGESVLMLHQGIKELSPNIGYELSLGDLPENFLYYALGHIHKSYIDSKGYGKVAYPGSLERWDFGDYSVRYRLEDGKLHETKGSEKGFFIVEDFEPRFVKLDVRPFIDIHVDEENIDKLITLTKRVPKEAFLRISVIGDSTIIKKLEAIKSYFKAEHIVTRVKMQSSDLGGYEKINEDEYFEDFEKKVIEKISQDWSDDEILKLILENFGYKESKKVKVKGGTLDVYLS
ncbi:metallophosphoesterase [Methanocaldococcus infernus]